MLEMLSIVDAERKEENWFGIPTVGFVVALT
jgi:hypothetical protein